MRPAAVAASLAFAVLALGAPIRAAEAGPTMRFGLTMAALDESAPEQREIGPMIGVGARLGPVLLEVDYALLSFMEPDVSRGGMHRVGANLRADLYRRTNHQCISRLLACTRGTSVYAQAGVAMRYGQWHLDADTREPATSRQREAHVGLGFELDNKIVPYRYGWQFGVRFALAPRSDLAVACRSSGGCAGLSSDEVTGYDRAVLVEWTFLIGQ